MFRRNPENTAGAGAPVAPSLRQLEAMDQKIKQNFMPCVESCVESITIANDLKLENFVTPGPDNRLAWNNPLIMHTLSLARVKSGIPAEDYNECKTGMEQHGIDNWEQRFNEEACFTAVLSTMKQTVAWGVVDKEKIATFRRLPFTSEEIPKVQESWLNFLLESKGTLASEVFRRACDVYANISALTPTNDPLAAQPRGIIQPKSGKQVKVSANALDLLNAELERAKREGPRIVVGANNPTHTLKPKDIEEIRDLTFNGGHAEKHDTTESAKRALHAINEGRRRDVRRSMTATGVGALGLGLVVQPAAAEVRVVVEDTANRIPSLNVPGPVAMSYAFVETVVTTEQGATNESTLAVPLAVPQQIGLSTARSGFVKTVSQTPSAASLDPSTLSIQFEPAVTVGPTANPPVVGTTQTRAKVIDPLENFRRGGFTPAEQVLAAATVGLDSPAVLTDSTSNSAGTERTGLSAESAIKTLASANVLLDSFVDNTLKVYTGSTDMNGVTETVVSDISFRGALTYLKGAKDNLGILASVSKEQKEQLLAGLSPAQAKVVSNRSAEFLAQIQRGENGAGVGLSEPQQKDLAAYMAIVSLGAEGSDLGRLLVAQAQEAINQKAADAAKKRADEERASRGNGESPAAGTGLEKATEKQLLTLVQETAKRYKWSAKQEMFFAAAILEGYPIAPSCLVCGAGGNSKPESDGFNANIEEYGNGIGFGLFQWSFERRVELERAAKGKVDLTVNNMANYRFQLRFAKNEMQKRDVRNNESKKEWDFFTSITDPEEVAWQFQFSFERPKHEDRQSNRTEASKQMWDQLNATWKVITKPKPAEAPKTSSENGKYPELWSGLPDDDRKRIIDRLENTKRDGAQLLETVAPNKVNEMARYENGNLPDDVLMVVDSAGHKMEKASGLAWMAMAAAYKADHNGEVFEIGGSISAYRDIAGQRKVAGTARAGFAADVGESKHGLGIAVDMGPVMGDNAGGFNSKAAKWFKINGPRFGFFWKYAHRPESRTAEPWHIEYHG